MKKGFLQIIEVGITALVIVLVIPGLFSAIDVKYQWDRPDLLRTGISVLSALERSGNASKIMSEPQTVLRSIERIVPWNMRFGLGIKNSPKPYILVGCVCSPEDYENVRKMLTPAFYNGRWVNFTVNLTDPRSIGVHDVALFVNYSGPWGLAEIENYLKSGKGIVSVNDTLNPSQDFLDLFGLETVSGSNPQVSFRGYDSVEKYFIAFGFDVNATENLGSVVSGTWTVWNQDHQVNITQTGRVQISGANPSDLGEGDYFYLTVRPDYYFKVKKVWPREVIIQPVNLSYPFENFLSTSEDPVRGKVNIVSSRLNALVTRNGTAIWISGFPAGDDYRVLLKAALASLVTDFYYLRPKEGAVVVSSFVPFCCDISEVVELDLYLWYAV